MKKISNGFTLVESLISISIIAIIGLIITSLLSNTFQSNAKTQLISTIKQNGQTALSNIEQTIRQSDSVLCIGTANGTPQQLQDNTGQVDGDTIMLINTTQNSNKYIRYRFVASTAISNGYLLADSVLKVDASDYTHCFDATTPTMINASQNVIDNNSATGLSIKQNANQSFFSINRRSGAKDAITIAFALGPSFQNQNITEKSLGDTGSLPFQTTVVLR